jgi:hypothetical protein
MYVCVYVCMHACTYVCMYVCVYVCMYVCTFMFRRSSYFISRVDMKAQHTVRSEIRDPIELHSCENCRREGERARKSTINRRLSESGIIKCTTAIIRINVHVSARERSVSCK